MIERLRENMAELQALRFTMQDPAVYGNPKRVAQTGRAIAELEELETLLKEYDACERALAEGEALKDDPDVGETARQEAASAAQRKEAVERRMKTWLIPKDPLDDRGVLLEVRAGTGGEEAALFAAELLRMYVRYCEEKGWPAELVERTDADAGGLKEATLRIDAHGAYSWLKFEAGVHRVQRIPATESKGRIHTSAATVAVLPEVEEEDLQIRSDDLRIETFRAGGAGGQHVNKTESAVRITHLPTGVVASCQSERSQLQNRQRAMDMLRAKLVIAERERKAKEEGDLRFSQIGSGDRSEKIRTYNYPQDRVTDHRIGKNFHNLPAIMEGDIGPMIEELRQADEREKMSGHHAS